MRPEYNTKISSASLMAPFTFMNNVGFPIRQILQFFEFFNFRDIEFAPHSKGQETMGEIFCSMFGGSICNAFLNFLLGPSENQRNNVIMKFHLKIQCNIKNKFFFLDDVGGNTSTLSSWFVLLIYVKKKKIQRNFSFCN